jgi:glycosyltransferase involved in cell wall biosynthesis
MQIGVDKKDILHTLRYSFLDFWLSPLPWLAEEVRQKTRMRSGRIRVVPHGMEMEPFIHLTLSKKEARAKLGLPLEAFLIGCIGRIDPGKGQLMLVKALERIRQVNARVELVLVGEPTRNETNLYYAQICQFITDSNLKGYVHLRPFSDDVALYFKSFDLFALASAKETYGLVTLESMASGTPVIGTNSGGTTEILKQGELGYLFPPGDVDEFCRLVLHIIDHPEEAFRKAKEALLHVKACFAHTAECDLLESILLPLRR